MLQHMLRCIEVTTHVVTYGPTYVGKKKKYNIGYDICDGICCNMGREIKQQKIISICYNKLLRHMLQRMLSTSNGNISSMWYNTCFNTCCTICYHICFYVKYRQSTSICYDIRYNLCRHIKKIKT